MSGFSASFLVQISPILAGIAAMLLIKGIRFPEPKVKVLIPEEAAKLEGSMFHSCEFVWSGGIALPRDCAVFCAGPATRGLQAFYCADSQGARFWQSHIGDSENMRTGVFRRAVYDGLVVNGLVSGCSMRGRNISGLALEKLGMVDINDVRSLARLLARIKVQKLKVFAPRSNLLSERLISIDENSCLLLAYALDYCLEVEGGC